MSRNFPLPTGDLNVSTDMPDRGTSTGVDDTYGADLSEGATNRKGSITSATKSDAPFVPNAN